MNCTRFYECISLYIDNELNDIEKENFEKHLRECEECRIECEEMLSITSMLREVEEVELPKNYNETLRQKLEDVNKSKNKKNNFKKFSSIAAAVIVLISSVTLIMDNINLKQNDIAYESNESAQKIEQFNVNEEKALDDSSENIGTQFRITSVPEKSLMKNNATSLDSVKIIRNEVIYVNADDTNKTSSNIVNFVENNVGYIEINETKYLKARVYVEAINNVLNYINDITKVSNINTINTDITKEYKDIQNTIKELRNTHENNKKTNEEIEVYEELLEKYNQMLEYPSLEIYFNSKSE